VSFEKVEKYISHAVKLETWRAFRDQAQDELDQLVASLSDTTSWPMTMMTVSIVSEPIWMNWLPSSTKADGMPR
jgi:hypothetical protein